MIEKYIEKDILRQVKILEYFYESRELTTRELSHDLNVSEKTILKDFSKIEQVLGDTISFENRSKGKYYFYLLEEKNSIQLAREIYDSSLFLKICCRYLMGEKDYSVYVEEEFISVSKAFNVRNDVESFLKDMNLIDSNGNKVENELKKRLVMLSVWMRNSLMGKYINKEYCILAESVATDILDYSDKKANSREKDMLTKGIALILFGSKLDELSKKKLKETSFGSLLKEVFDLISNKIAIDEDEFRYISVLFYLIPTSYTSYSVMNMDLEIQKRIFLQFPEIEYYIYSCESYFGIRLADNNVFLQTILYFILFSYYNVQSYLVEPHVILNNKQKVLCNSLKQITLGWKKNFPLETNKYRVTNELLKRMSFDLYFVLQEEARKPIFITVVGRNAISHMIFKKYILDYMPSDKVKIDECLYYSLADVKIYKRDWKQIILCEESLIIKSILDNFTAEIISVSRYNLEEARNLLFNKLTNE
ncbi:helix-turn-helix domain-containing protein [Enterococcus faecium]|uniref:helix-turn-helix domain-containing protein n=1 Tax=Enterococcus faecium TaxID=1352 RepID=UPI00145C37C6|nr:helix-turn-helix domain-containing protein [Enterococcus faecium]EME7129086.1 helix-turn-helix domain-containing protein [Enterococcus faecium]EMF0494250.1 helix-turn-helix domain-containing protein [Enterococcus faecium]NMP53733.1 DeoR family transcriptional regulator [Enterococcus faecium]